MLKIYGYILATCVLVSYVTAETFDNRTTPHTHRPQPVEGTGSTIKVVYGGTPARSSSTASTAHRPPTPSKPTVITPARQGLTPGQSASTTRSRPATPVSRPPTPAQQTGSTAQSRPPTPVGSTSRRPTPTQPPATGSSTSRRPTPGNVESQSTSLKLTPTIATGTGTSTTRLTPTGSTPTTSIMTPTPTMSSSTTPEFTSPTPSINSSTTELSSSSTGLSTSTSGISTTSPEISTSSPIISTSSPIISTSSPIISSSSAIVSTSTSPVTTTLTESISPSSSTPTISTTTSVISSSSVATSSSSASPTSSSSVSSSSESPSSSSGSSSSLSPSSSTTTPSTSISSSISSSSPSSSTTQSTSLTSSTTITVSTSTPSTSTSPSTSSSTTPTTTTTSTTPTTPSVATNTPSTSTITPSTSSSTTSSPSYPTGTPPIGGKGPITHVQIMFCDKYRDLDLPRDPIEWTDYLSKLQLALSAFCGVGYGRIKNVYLVEDPESGNPVLQFDVIPGVGASTTDVVLMISEEVKKGTFRLIDKNGYSYNVNCPLPKYPMYPWTDYGPCPRAPCQHNGICRVAITGHYFCECPSGWAGALCDQPVKPTGPEKEKDNLWLLWLLIVPLVLLGLLLLLCCFCCCHRCCAAAAPRQQKVQIIEEDIYQDVPACSERGTVRSCRSSCRPSIYAIDPVSSPMCVNDAGSTYYSALGRPFAVAFSDNTFSAVGYASNDMGVYNTCGKKMIAPSSCCGDGEIEVIMNGRRGSRCGSVCSDGYHSAMGNRYAVAYNDRSFNTYSSMPRVGSIRHYN